MMGAEAFRVAMVAELRERGFLSSNRIADAFAQVPRHVFVPEVSLGEAYETEHAVVTKRGPDGVALSSVSAVRIQAFMLEQADIRPGMGVLEIGSGGYNAALMTELLGGAGEVTTIDIDPDVVERARRLLATAGYDEVLVILADGHGGEPENAPYDRIVVTAEASDLPKAWVDQLVERGRLVVPLWLRGLTRSISFQRASGYLTSRDYQVCGFVPIQGIGADQEPVLLLHDDDDERVVLRLADRQQVHAEPLCLALARPHVAAWSGVTIRQGRSYEHLDLWLATTAPSFARLEIIRRVPGPGLIAAGARAHISTFLDDSGDSFAYLATRPYTSDSEVFEFGAIGHGPAAHAVVQRLIAEIQAWDQDHRNHRPEIRAYPAGTPDSGLPAGRVLDRSESRIVISWPAVAVR